MKGAEKIKHVSSSECIKVHTHTWKSSDYTKPRHVVFLQVIAIRRNLFQSADFKLTTTELKDHIKAMVTLLEDPTQLKNDAHATQAVQQLHQVKHRCKNINVSDVTLSRELHILLDGCLTN